MTLDPQQHYSAFLPDEGATVSLAQRLGELLSGGEVIFLDGTLGAGKTTFCRGILQAFGYSGAVKSPTYTLVEPYQLNDKTLYHFDLYRLCHPEELEFVGVRDYFSPDRICLVEWPSRGAGFLPDEDLLVNLWPDNTGRKIDIVSKSALGDVVLKSLIG